MKQLVINVAVGKIIKNKEEEKEYGLSEIDQEGELKYGNSNNC